MQKAILTSLIFGGVFFIFNFAAAATADHLVISQVQITGGPGKTTNDFAEIYNPTGEDIDLKGMRLVKRTKTGATDTLLKSWTDTTIIKAHGYYLWANSSYSDISITPDVTTSGSIAADNGIAIRNGPNDTGTIIDSVGWGEAANAFVEGVVFSTNPDANQSLERKPGSGQGNGEDTNNNSADFFAQVTAHPRNSSSPTETPSPSSDRAAAPPAPSGGGFFELEISEIMPNPKGKDAGFEWIELYNAGAAVVNISGWYLDDDGEEESPSSNAYLVPDRTLISGKSYLAVQIPKGKFALNNSGLDAARLFDSNKNLKLRQSYTGPAKEGYAYAKNSSNDWEWTENATPGAANNFAILTTYSSNLRISEVLPDPEGDDSEGEFIEIYNLGTDSVDLADWVIADERKRYTISDEDFTDTEIPPNGYFAVYREISGISLNNSGEEAVRLINPLGEVADEFKFDASGKENQSYARELEKFYRWTSFLTPGEKNKFVPVQGIDEEQSKSKNPRLPAPQGAADGGQAKPKIEIPLSEVRSYELGTIITTSGVIVVEPGILGERVSYLKGSGIRIFLPDNFDSVLKAGMKIQLAGELASFHKELQLKISDSGSIEILNDNEPVTPHEIKTGQVGEETEGFFVTIAGEVTRSSGDTFYIDDGSGEARILIGESAGIQKPKMKQGDEIQITGVVTQFNDIYRVMPRYQSDLVFGTVVGADTGDLLPRTGNNFWLIVAFLSGFCYSFVIIKIIKLKRKETKNEQSRVI